MPKFWSKSKSAKCNTTGRVKFDVKVYLNEDFTDIEAVLFGVS